MKKFLVFLCAILLVFGVAGTASATLINGGFESGDFTGWTTYVPSGGSANVVTGHSIWGPLEGTYFALLNWQWKISGEKAS